MIKNLQDNMKEPDAALETAWDHGIRVVQFAGYDVYYEPSNETTRGQLLSRGGEVYEKICNWTG